MPEQIAMQGRVAEPFERHGRWWDARTPEIRWYGTLTYSASGSTRLLITTPMTLNEYHRRERKHPLIHGLTDVGERVSLLACFETHAEQDTSDDHAKREIVANRVVMGFHVTEPEVLVSDVIATFDTARDWAAQSGLTIDADLALRGGYNFTFNPPDDVVLFDDGKMKITLFWALEGARLTADDGDIDVREVVKIGVSVKEPRPLLHVLEKVYAIQNLLSVACLRLCTLERLVIGVGEVPESRRSGTYHVPPRYVDSRPRDREPNEHLFLLSDVEDPRQLFALWFEKEKKLRSILGLYLSGLYVDRFIGAKVLSLAQAGEVFHRRFRAGSYFDEGVYTEQVLSSLIAALPADLTDDTRKALVGKLTYLNQLSLRTRLKRLAAESADVWKLLHVRPTKFIDPACRYRDQLVHYSSEDDDIGELRVLELSDCVSFLAALVELSIMREVGFSVEAIARLARQTHTYYRRFVHLA